MKKISVFLVIVFLLSGCSTHTYEDGYKDGYSDAKFELEAEYELYLDERYLDGYSHGFDRVANSKSDAESYACDRSVYHPEEALMIIDAYESEEPYWRNGDPITQQDYSDAARSLYYFYEYYFNGEFSYFQDP